MGLLTSDEAVGRQFKFLCQEFNQEANTLRFTSNDVEITKVGLSLKTFIDQMREQGKTLSNNGTLEKLKLKAWVDAGLVVSVRGRKNSIITCSCSTTLKFNHFSVCNHPCKAPGREGRDRLLLRRLSQFDEKVAAQEFLEYAMGRKFLWYVEATYNGYAKCRKRCSLDVDWWVPAIRENAQKDLISILPHLRLSKSWSGGLHPCSRFEAELVVAWQWQA